MTGTLRGLLTDVVHATLTSATTLVAGKSSWKQSVNLVGKAYKPRDFEILHIQPKFRQQITIMALIQSMDTFMKARDQMASQYTLSKVDGKVKGSPFKAIATSGSG